MKYLLIIFYLLMTSYSFSQWINIFPKEPIAPRGFSHVQFFDNNIGYGSQQQGGLVVKTTNGGKSWEKVLQGTNDYDHSLTFFVDKNIGYIAGVRSIQKTTDGGSRWTECYSGNLSYVTGIYFIDKNIGYVNGGYSVGMLKTTNGGITWDTLSSAPRGGYVGWGGNTLYFIDQFTGFVFGSYSSIEKTTDGGKTWNYKRTSDWNTWSIPEYYTMFFINSDTGFVAGSYGGIAKTVDKGETWTPVRADNSNYFSSIFFTDSKTGYVSSGRDIFKTTNCGASWEELPDVEFGYIQGICFTDSNTCYAACGYPGLNASVIKTTDGGKNWTDTDASFGNKIFSNICFTNEYTGYIAGTGGTILKCSNGIDYWEKLNTGTFKDLRSIYFTDKETGFAAGYEYASEQKGIIIQTTDAGSTWNRINYKSPAYIISLCFSDKNTAFGLSDSGTILKSTDGCLSWSKINVDSKYALLLPVFTDSLTGYTAESHNIYKTTDAGVSWSNLFVLTNAFISNMYFANHDTGFAVGYPGLILKTTDAGKSWKNVMQETEDIVRYPADLRSVFFANDKIGYAAGSYSRIVKTTDGGDSWNYIEAPAGYNTFNSIYFMNPDEGIIAGDNGIIAKTSNGGGPFITSIEKTENLAPGSFHLDQNYPNPFNPTTTISYSIPKESQVELRIYDMLGREVSTLISKEQNAGKYDIQFNASSLPSGIYIYTIQAGQFRDSKKMILIK